MRIGVFTALLHQWYDHHMIGVNMSTPCVKRAVDLILCYITPVYIIRL